MYRSSYSCFFFSRSLSLFIIPRQMWVMRFRIDDDEELCFFDLAFANGDDQRISEQKYPRYVPITPPWPCECKRIFLINEKLQCDQRPCSTDISKQVSSCVLTASSSTDAKNAFLHHTPELHQSFIVALLLKPSLLDAVHSSLRVHAGGPMSTLQLTTKPYLHDG